mgnify:FL=1
MLFGHSDEQGTLFVVRMVRIIEHHREWIAKHSGRLLKGDTVLGLIQSGLCLVPLEIDVASIAPSASIRSLSSQQAQRRAHAAERQASAGARDGVKGKRNDLAARALKKLTCKLLILRTAYS